MKRVFILVVIQVALLLSSCNLRDSAVSDGGTIVGNGIICGYVEMDDSVVTLAKTHVVSSTRTNAVVYLYKDSALVDSQTTVAAFFKFAGLGLGMYSVTARDAYGHEAKLDGIPIDSFTIEAIQVLLQLHGGTTVSSSSSGIGADPIDVYDTITIQPDAENSQDADVHFAYNYSTGTPYIGAYGELNVGQKPCINCGSYDPNSHFRLLIQFPLPDSLRNYSVVSSRILLFPHDWMALTIQSAFSVATHKILKSWKEGSGWADCGGSPKTANSATVNGVTAVDRFWTDDGSAKWNQIGVGLDDIDAAQSAAAISVIAYGSTQPLDIDVTNLTEQWIASPEENNGVLIRNLAEFSGSFVSYPHFYSGEASDASLRPTLKIIVNKRIAGVSSSSVSSVVQSSSEGVSSQQANASISSSSIDYSSSATDTLQTLTLRSGLTDAPDVTIVFAQSGQAGSVGGKNSGLNPCMEIGSYDANTILRTLIKFDLSGKVPSGASIQKATLVLTPYAWTSRTSESYFAFAIHKMLVAWKEGSGYADCEAAPTAMNSAAIDGATGIERFYSSDGSAKWHAIGVGIDNVDADSIPVVVDSLMNKQTSSISVDITSLVQGWVADESSNNGMLLRYLTEYSSSYHDYPHFYSGESTVETNRPTLILSFK